MLGHLECVDVNKDQYHVVEFYAGAARLAKLTSGIGGSATAFDRTYDKDGDNKKKRNAMDFNTSGGFLSRICIGIFLS